MEFPEAVRLALRDRLFDYQGRSRRSEYWWYWAFYLIVWFVSYFLFIGAILVLATDGGDPGVAGVVVIVLYLALNIVLLVPGIAVTVRRLHDLDRTGWWVLTTFIPLLGLFFGIMLLIWFGQEGTEGTNRFGIDPKAHEAF